MLKKPPSIIIQLLAENKVELKAALIEIYTSRDSFKGLLLHPITQKRFPELLVK